MFPFNSNHGSFYYNQLASIYLILDDKPAAKAVLQEYFNGIFQNQITATGEQVSMIYLLIQHWECLSHALRPRDLSPKRRLEHSK